MTTEQRRRANAANARWKAKNYNKVARYKKKHYAENRDKFLTIERERSYKKLYGIGIAEYDLMFAVQGRCCAICGATVAVPGKADRAFCVDHCHDTNKVRGLLCLACNHLLGRYEKHASAIHAYLHKQRDEAPV